jgi:hypothetical protein
VFGFVEFCTIYGGRPFFGRELSDADIKTMYDNGIGLRLPLTNHFVSQDEYKQYANLLDKYHRKGNSVITVSDDLAIWIKNDYPQYAVTASAIKDISSLDRITTANKIYDSVALPMRCSQNFDFLASIPNKDRITLFGNASCGINCPKVLCYEAISRGMKTSGTGFVCSMLTVPRKFLGPVDFDIAKLANLGFNQFKLLNYKNFFEAVEK